MSLIMYLKININITESLLLGVSPNFNDNGNNFNQYLTVYKTLIHLKDISDF